MNNICRFFFLLFFLFLYLYSLSTMSTRPIFRTIKDCPQSYPNFCPASPKLTQTNDNPLGKRVTLVFPKLRFSPSQILHWSNKDQFKSKSHREVELSFTQKAEMAQDPDYGAFMEKFLLQPPSTQHELPLNSLTFATKDIFDLEGHVSGFGNPDWARTHPAATSTAPAVLAILRAGGTSIGKTIMDEMAYSINGENVHYGTPRNPCAADRVPGGSSSGSAVAVGAGLVDFSLGTDTGGSVRVPASYCGIFGFRPSHGVVSTSGVIPMAQSFDTVGWFARDPVLLSKVGRILLQLPHVDPVRPSQLIIAEDCFKLSTILGNQVTEALHKSVEKLFGGESVDLICEDVLLKAAILVSLAL